MIAMSNKAVVAASASVLIGGDGTVMTASAAETTLKARAEVSARVWAGRSGCGKGRGMS